jgi:hypothetical protein
MLRKPGSKRIPTATDEILPSQLRDQMTAVTDVPERRLLIALLFDAIRILHNGAPKQRSEIVSWIRGMNAARVPFRVMCEGLDLEPECLARRLLQKGVAHVPTRLRAHGSRRRRVLQDTSSLVAIPSAADLSEGATVSPAFDATELLDVPPSSREDDPADAPPRRLQ